MLVTVSTEPQSRVAPTRRARGHGAERERLREAERVGRVAPRAEREGAGPHEVRVAARAGRGRERVDGDDGALHREDDAPEAVRAPAAKTREDGPRGRRRRPRGGVAERRGQHRGPARRGVDKAGERRAPGAARAQAHVAAGPVRALGRADRRVDGGLEAVRERGEEPRARRHGRLRVDDQRDLAGLEARRGGREPLADARRGREAPEEEGLLGLARRRELAEEGRIVDDADVDGREDDVDAFEAALDDLRPPPQGSQQGGVEGAALRRLAGRCEQADAQRQPQCR